MSNRNYPTEAKKKVTKREMVRIKSVNTETGKSSQTRSSSATDVCAKPNKINRNSPFDSDQVGEKKKAASGSSRSHHVTHKHMQEKEKEKKIKMVGQSAKCFCGICFDFKLPTDMFRSGECNHSFCNGCISKHVAAQIQQNVLKVNCPNPRCVVELKQKYLQQILPEEVIVRWESANYESSIARWQKIYCPFKNCSVLLVNDGDRGNVVTSSECPSCHRLFCAQCKVPWHAEINCKEFQKLTRRNREKDLDRKLIQLAKKEMWKKCPKCSFYVQRLDGCEHITCRCGWNFCYKCGKDWKFGHLCSTRPSA